jgi:biofilm PGA synthesis N-glycosyltransferase PgaC
MAQLAQVSAGRRLWRVLIVLLCGFAAAAVLLAVHAAYLNRLTLAVFLVRVSTLVLVAFLCVVVARYALLMWFAWLQHVEHMTEPLEAEEHPLVTIVVPAYNEGKMIVASVRSLMEMDYPRFEVVVVDDGSSDDTFERAQGLVAVFGEARLRAISQTNGGKAAALNTGIAAARGEIVLCMDGDSLLEPQTLRQAVKHFQDPTVGAVAGNVKVANRLNALTRLQALEYIEGLSLVRTAHAFFRRVVVIPGPIGLFRKRVIEDLGGYLRDTFAEDCELTLRIMAAGWKVKYESKAVAWTEAPETHDALFKQRYRWSRGILQAVLKHSSRLRRPDGDLIDWIFLWVLVFEAVIWPAMNVFAILFFVAVGFWAGLGSLVVLWWAQITVLDMVAALFCVSLEQEDLKLTFYAVLYRLYFIPLIDVIKLFASVDEMLGVGMGWGKLERLGRI